MSRIRIGMLVAFAMLAFVLPAGARNLPPGEIVQVHESWIYDDIDAGFEKARETKKPMLVVMRCIP